jgi:hypothetical protein
MQSGMLREGHPRSYRVSGFVPVLRKRTGPSMRAWRDDSSEDSREVKRVVMTAVAVAILVVGGWFIFSLLPAVVKQALQPLSIPRVRAVSASPNSIPVAPTPLLPRQFFRAGPRDHGSRSRRNARRWNAGICICGRGRDSTSDGQRAGELQRRRS